MTRGHSSGRLASTVSISSQKVRGMEAGFLFAQSRPLDRRGDSVGLDCPSRRHMIFKFRMSSRQARPKKWLIHSTKSRIYVAHFPMLPNESYIAFNVRLMFLNNDILDRAFMSSTISRTSFMENPNRTGEKESAVMLSSEQQDKLLFSDKTINTCVVC